MKRTLLNPSLRRSEKISLSKCIFYGILYGSSVSCAIHELCARLPQVLLLLLSSAIAAADYCYWPLATLLATATWCEAGQEWAATTVSYSTLSHSTLSYFIFQVNKSSFIGSFPTKLQVNHIAIILLDSIFLKQNGISIPVNRRLFHAGKTPTESKSRKRKRREPKPTPTLPSSRRLSFSITATAKDMVKESVALPGEKDEKNSPSIHWSGETSLSEAPLGVTTKSLKEDANRQKEESSQPKMEHEPMSTSETASMDIPVRENPSEQEKTNPAESGTKIQPEEHVPRFAFQSIFFFKIWALDIFRLETVRCASWRGSVYFYLLVEVTLVLGNQRHRQKNLRSMFASRSGGS